ncbi:MAG: MBL fold metallo-hydrolase [Alphaproteobacteria bacterium]|nr:MBL fold metallo-hydrolase [Alphaproteobacteria bacterium]
MTTPLPLNRDFDVRYGELEVVAPGIRRITAHNPGPFTFRGTGTFVLGTGKVAVLDPGPDQPEHVEALLAGLGQETVSHILVTHTHRDHSPAARVLKQATGAPTWGFGPHGGGRRPGGGEVEAGGDFDFVPDNTVGDGDRIEGDDWAVTCVHTPGHTSNHLSFSWDERRVLFPGDHVMGWSTSIVSPPDGDMRAYMRSLELLLERDDGIYYPAHGPEIRDPHVLVRAFIAHRHEREDRVLACLDRGIGTVGEMVPLVYEDVAAHLHAAAARSLLATLIHLVEDGRAEALGALTVEGRYRAR